MCKYDLGIIGGMGSEATVEIYKRIVNKTVHTNDQEHMKICILNNSMIPDRTNYILNNGKNPLPYLLESVKDLEKIGVNYFVVPCNTAHYFESEFKKADIKFISMVEETLKIINETYKNYKICILGTTGTIHTKVYHNHPLAKNIDFVFATDDEQKDIMNIINETKSDVDRYLLTNKLLKIVEEIKKREGNCLFVLACTELSLYYNKIKENSTVIDAMNCLVESAIIKCGYKIKK